MEEQHPWLTYDERNMTITLDEEEGTYLKAKFAVCGRCEGSGSHVNPAVDGNGIPAQEFYDDPDFAEAYFSGTYDVSCESCSGKRVVLVPDEDHPHNTAELMADFESAWGDLYEDMAIRRAEMGAW